jgi:hypothetical protein
MKKYEEKMVTKRVTEGKKVKEKESHYLIKFRAKRKEKDPQISWYVSKKRGKSKKEKERERQRKKEKEFIYLVRVVVKKKDEDLYLLSYKTRRKEIGGRGSDLPNPVSGIARV